MDTKALSDYRKRSYEDFEPYCHWHRGEGSDVLEVHLQGFKREQLRVQINDCGILLISGEQPVEDTKYSRFRKEIKVSKDSDANKIRAKLVRGILYITLPKSSSQADLESNSQPPSKTENGPLMCGSQSLLKIEISKKMAICVGGIVAVGIVVGGILIWKNSQPGPLMC
ncbi:hypothetical protein UlMin_006861 [Ulmus minor]